MLFATLLLGVFLLQAQVKQPTVGDARTLQASGRLSEARDEFERVLESSPGDGEAAEGMALVSEQLALKERAAGDRDAALAELLRARRRLPGNARVLYDLGVLEEEMHLYRDADATLASLERQQPGEAKVLYAAARVKLDLGQLDGAEERMEAYLKLRPDDASAHYGLGMVYLQGANFEKARGEFERSVALQPLQTEAYYQLGQTYLNTDACAEAEPNFRKTLDRQPKHGGALTGMGVCAFKGKKFDAAEGWLQRAIQAAPEYQPGHYYLGLVLRRLGRDAESREQLGIATRLEEEESRKNANRLRLNEPTAN